MIPKRLAHIVHAFGRLLTGEQIESCLNMPWNEFEQHGERDLSASQRDACEWVLEDDEMPKHYGIEYAGKLEELRRVERQCKSALDAMAKQDYWHDELSSIEHAVERLRARETAAKEALKQASELTGTEAHGRVMLPDDA